MSRGRTPNAGPYIVSFTNSKGETINVECHTWAYACGYMRQCLIENHQNITVKFV
jgi:hypothetical protein